MIPNCRETTRLASEAIEHPLTWRQRMQVAMHLMMCGPCRRARRMMRFLHDAWGRLGRGEFEQLLADQSLTPEMRARIKAAIRRHSPTDEKPEDSL